MIIILVQSSNPHYIVLRSGKEQTCQDSLLCDENKHRHRKPTPREAYWFPGEIPKFTCPSNYRSVMSVIVLIIAITIGLFYIHGSQGEYGYGYHNRI